MLFIIGLVVGLALAATLDWYMCWKIVKSERNYYNQKIWKLEQALDEHKLELKHAARQATLQSDYIQELEAEIRQAEEDYYNSDEFNEELDRWYKDQDNGAEEVFAKLENEEFCRECERDEPCIRHNFFAERPKEWYRIDIEDEGIRYWWYTSTNMEGATGAVKEEPPADAPSSHVFFSDEERRNSPLYQHLINSF